MMKKLLLITVVLMAISLSACHKGYDSRTCAVLSERVATQAPLSQDDYADMIEQSDHILHYLMEAADSISAIPDRDRRRAAAAALRADREFLERFDYMFTFSSVLYRAHLSGALSAENAEAYENLDAASGRLASLSARL